MNIIIYIVKNYQDFNNQFTLWLGHKRNKRGKRDYNNFKGNYIFMPHNIFGNSN